MFILSRISFSLVNDRARYTHFVEPCGRVVTMYDLNRVPEARVGVVCPADFPTDEQRYSIVRLAQFATGINPAAVIEFGEAVKDAEHIVQHFEKLGDDYRPSASMVADVCRAYLAALTQPVPAGKVRPVLVDEFLRQCNDEVLVNVPHAKSAPMARAVMDYIAHLETAAALVSAGKVAAVLDRQKQVRDCQHEFDKFGQCIGCKAHIEETSFGNEGESSATTGGK